MVRFLIIGFLFGIVSTLSGQVVKDVLVKSVPEGARVINISGRADVIGNTPIKHAFNFHSDVSVIKVKLSACGYYDTIIKITPITDSLRILMYRKKFLILPESENDVLPENEHKQISLVVKSFLEDFSKKNIREPVNFMDFAVLKRTDQKTLVTLLFEVDPERLTIPRTVRSDSLLKKHWDEWFSMSSVLLGSGQNSYLKNVDFFFSVISGKEILSIRHIPGVDINDEMKVKTSVYEDNYKRVSTTTVYYETVTSPTFNTSLNQSQKYNELLYRFTTDTDGKNFGLSGMAVINFSNNKMNVLFESEPGLSGYTMLKKFVMSK
jgi:hypothetical protein